MLLWFRSADYGCKLLLVDLPHRCADIASGLDLKIMVVWHPTSGGHRLYNFSFVLLLKKTGFTMCMSLSVHSKG